MLDIVAGPGSSSPLNLTDDNGTLFFSADGNDGKGRELWTSNGTLGGTHLFKDINPGAGNSFPQEMAVASGKLLFAADDGVTGGELYVSDGTPGGTQRITDINPGPQGGMFYDSGGNSSIQASFSDGTTYYFAADTGVGLNEVHLWKSNGTAAGTTPVSSSLFGPNNFARASDGKIYCNGHNPSNGNAQVWVTQGSDATTAMLADAVYVSSPTAVAGQAYFMQRSTGLSADLKRTAGSTPTLVKTFDGIPYTPLGAVAGSLLFGAFTMATGTELWSTDGSGSGTQLLRDFSQGASGSGITGITKSGNFAFFKASAALGGPELFATDLTTGGTSLVKDLTTASSGGSPSYLTDVDGTLFFDGYNGNTWQVWKSNGTAANTTVVSTSVTAPNATFFFGNPFAAFQHALYFTGTDATGTGLWRTDGTTTTRIKNFSGPVPTNLHVIGDTLYFFASDTLWKSNGTDVGTVPVIVPLAGHFPSTVVATNDALFFLISNIVDTGPRIELWRSDGSAAGTFLLSSQASGALAVAGSSVYFSAYQSETGAELWGTDGTAAGTSPVADIRPGPLSSSISSMVDVGGTLYFVANDGAHGYEIWTSDGMAAGTRMLEDVVVGSGDMQPTQLAAIGTDIYFAATDDAHGQELWKMTDTYAPIVTSSGFDVVGAAAGPTVNIHFSENVVGVDATKLTVTDQQTGQPLPAGTFSFTYDAGKHLASFTATAGLPDGNYQAVLDAPGIGDAAGNALAGGATVPFFVLTADANHDRYVNTLDFNAIAQNFNKSSAVFSQGDLNYDGRVNALDFNIMATKFGTYLAPPTGSAMNVAAPGLSMPTPSLFTDRRIAEDTSVLQLVQQRNMLL